MSICTYCKKEMLDPTVTTCDKQFITLDEVMYNRLPYDPEDKDPSHHCHDCGIKAGGFHHFGCDVELCPKCGEQLIVCNCHIHSESVSKKFPHLSYVFQNYQDGFVKVGPGTVTHLPPTDATIASPGEFPADKWNEQAMWKTFDNTRAIFITQGISPLMAWHEVAVKIALDYAQLATELEAVQKRLKHTQEFYAMAKVKAEGLEESLERINETRLTLPRAWMAIDNELERLLMKKLREMAGSKAQEEDQDE